MQTRHWKQTFERFDDPQLRSGLASFPDPARPRDVTRGVSRSCGLHSFLQWKKLIARFAVAEVRFRSRGKFLMRPKRSINCQVQGPAVLTDWL